MREFIEWTVAGGIVLYVGRRALQIGEGFVPMRTKQDLREAEAVVQQPRVIRPISAAFHPDDAGQKLEQSFQDWAREQREKERDNTASGGG